MNGGLQGRQEPRHAVRAGRIAGRHLPHLADALELVDIERVETDQLARPFGMDVLAPLAAGAFLSSPSAGTCGLLTEHTRRQPRKDHYQNYLGFEPAQTTGG
jgi:hypothetical protein